MERKLQNVIGSSAQELVVSVRSHNKNCPVTAEDENLAEKIYGPNISGLRGKTVRRNKPAYEVDQIPISVPSKYRMVTLSADIFYVNTIFLSFGPTSKDPKLTH